MAHKLRYSLNGSWHAFASFPNFEQATIALNTLKAYALRPEVQIVNESDQEQAYISERLPVDSIARERVLDLYRNAGGSQPDAELMNHVADSDYDTRLGALPAVRVVFGA